MNKFIEKRDSLENYVKEQIIGPGAYNKKYFFLKDWENSEYYGKDLSQVSSSFSMITSLTSLIFDVSLDWVVTGNRIAELYW